MRGKQNRLIYKVSVEFYVLHRNSSGSFTALHIETGRKILFKGVRGTLYFHAAHILSVRHLRSCDRISAQKNESVLL